MKIPTLMALATLFALPSTETAAQTGCPIGSVQDSIVYTQTISNISSQTLVVSFPQAPASTSTFSGVTLRAWVNTAQSFTLTNLDLLTVPDYSVDVNRSTKFTGNGLNSNTAQNSSSYGPYALSGLGQAGSSVSVGPDSVFTQTFLSATTNNVTPFTGTGTVSVSYSNKALTGVNGSNNFSLMVSSNSTVRFTMTYYFCSASNLPAIFDDLQVRVANGNSILDWVSVPKRRAWPIGWKPAATAFISPDWGPLPERVSTWPNTNTRSRCPRPPENATTGLPCSFPVGR